MAIVKKIRVVTATGQVRLVPRHYLDHPVLGYGLTVDPPLAQQLGLEPEPQVSEPPHLDPPKQLISEPGEQPEWGTPNLVGEPANGNLETGEPNQPPELEGEQ